MEFLKNFNPKASTILKIAGLALVAVIVITLFFRLVGTSFNSTFRGNKLMQNSSTFDVMSDAVGEMAQYGAPAMVGLSARNVASVTSSKSVPQGNIISGNTAEAYEVTEYYANIETRKLDATCQAVADLKIRPDIIFENASKYDKGCNFVFKVKHSQADEILNVIKRLNPKDLNENIYTIKGMIDDFTSETEILQKKLLSIDETLTRAVDAYDEVTLLATKVKDVESLARVIDSKINVIERLTQERININSQLERIQRSKAEQLDRLEYTYFRINIFENKFIDGKNLVDSWKLTIKRFINDVNRVAQDITINLIFVILKICQFAIYLLILIVVAKYGWKLARYIWVK